ncbi:MAG: stringent starvation protein [Pseudomonadota bacterium]|jgi:stringent starvation protein B
MTPMRPYLLRAIYEWIVDNNFTPYILVDAEHPQVKVPQQYVRDGQIVLNVSMSAVRQLELENDWISFTARFSGASMRVYAPMVAVLAIYTKENGQGMIFQPEEALEQLEKQPPKEKERPVLKVLQSEEHINNNDDHNDNPPPPPKGKRPSLKIVK